MGFLSQVILALVFSVRRHWHILFAIILGFSLGIVYFAQDWGFHPGGRFLLGFFEFVGQLFIRLISMLVIPLVVSSLIIGVSSIKDARQLGRMGGKVLVLFMAFMFIAAVIGAVLAWFFHPGTLLQASPDLSHDALGLASDSAIRLQDLSEQVRHRTLQDFFLAMIPQNPVRALADMDLVPAIVFTLFFGFALAFIGPAGKPLVQFFEAMFTVSMKLTDWVMTLAVPGVFALAFVTVAESGMDIFIKLAPFALTMILGLLLQIFVVFPVVLKVFARIDFMNLYRAVSEAILVAFGTASSSATLPITIANCELRAGISNRIASFVLPTGASINKTGTTMFEVIAVMFLAHAYNIPLDLPSVVLIVLFAIIASIGAAGVPSAGLITLGIVLTSLGSSMGRDFNVTLFAGGIALLWSIDRVLDMCRTVVNVISSCTVAALVAASEGELKRDILNNPTAWREIS